MDEFEGLNAGGGDAYEQRARGTAVTVYQPRFPWLPAYADRYGAALKLTDEDAWRTLIDSIFPSARTLPAVLMALDYCRRRELDIFKRPVNIVPMWHSALGREIETVWPGISELRITAFRTGQYAGMDEAKFGPLVTTLFKGSIKNKRTGRYEEKEVPVEHHEWCRITVYRKLGDTITKFVGPKTFWIEAYATIGRTDIPNSMWIDRKVGQLEKVAEAAALRRAFPEELGNEYVSEEMHGRTIGTPVKTIEAQEEEVINALSAQEVERVPNGEDHAEPEPAQASEPEPEPEPPHWTEEIGLSTKSSTALKRAEITRAQAYLMSDEELLAIEGFGKTGLQHLRRAIGYPERKASPPPAREPEPAISKTPEAREPDPELEEPEVTEEPEPEQMAVAEREPEELTLPEKFRVALGTCDTPEKLQVVGIEFRDAFEMLKVSGDDVDRAMAEEMWADYQEVRKAVLAKAEELKAKSAEPEPEEGPPEDDARLYDWPDEVEKAIAQAGSSEQLRAWARELWDATGFDAVEARYREIQASDQYGASPSPERIAIVTIRKHAAQRYR